jgi:sugar lactone lactonase YvrE
MKNLIPSRAPFVLATLGYVILGCSTATGPGGSKGNLTVTITAPNGVTPSVTVTGPGSYSKTLTATQTLSGLASGSYTITAGAGLTADSIVSIAYSGAVTGSPASVTAHTTATATVDYGTKWNSSGVLWLGSTLGYSVSGFTSAQLNASGKPVPAVRIGSGTSTSAIQGVWALQIDQTGGLWISDGGDTLYYYTSAQIATSTTASPSRKLVDTALRAPSALALDAAGNLWLGDQGTSKIVEFTTAQLATGGTVTPPVIISSTLGSINRPFSMTFDAHGDLWVASYGDSTVAGFSPSQLQATGAPLPFAALSGSKGISNCIGVAFDAQGNLWVSTLVDTVAEFTPNELTSIGAPAPAVILSFPGFIELGPMAFDNSGALWLADVQGSRLLRLMPDQLTASGTPTASVTITSSGSGIGASIALPSWLAFSPHAAGLPPN